MHKISKAAALLSVMLVATIGGAGCEDDNPPTGTLRQTWTIAGAQNANACAQLGATQMRIVAVGSDGIVDATQFAPCTDFQTTATLQTDNYTGTATFLNATGLAVSKTLVLPPFTIGENLTTVRNIDFQLSDF